MVTYSVKVVSMVQEYVTWALPHLPAVRTLMTDTEHYPFPNTPAKFITEHRVMGNASLGLISLSATHSLRKIISIGHPH